MWLDGWTDRWQITITENNGVALFFHQVGPIPLAGHIDFSKFLRSGADMRVTDSDGVTLIQFWRQTWDYDAATGTLYIQIPFLLAGQSHTIYVYGGNPAVADASSYNQTMTKITDTTADGCVGLWHMDEGSGGTTADTSGNGNDGNIVTAAWQNTDGGNWDSADPVKRFDTGSHLYFSGNDYISVLASESLNLPSALTLEAWVYFLGNGTGNSPILFKTYANIGQYGLFRIWDTHLLDFSINLSGQWQDVLLSIRPLSNNRWHHIVATWNGIRANIYIDGELSNTTSLAGLIFGDSNHLLIGADDWGHPGAIGETLNGYIDEAAIYNRALSQGEVQAHYYRRKFVRQQPTWMFYQPTAGAIFPAWSRITDRCLSNSRITQKFNSNSKIADIVKVNSRIEIP